MAESARRNRGGVCPAVQALEGRVLLSRVARVTPSQKYFLTVHFSQENVSPQSGEVYVSVTRPPEGANKALRFKIRTTATVNDPAYLNASPYVRTMGGNPSTLPFVPIAGTYKFAPGQTLLTIPMKINPHYNPKGPIFLDVVAKPAWATSMDGPGSFLTISKSPEDVPPEVESWTISPQAIKMTFSKAMDPATVDDINNYEIFGYLTSTGGLAQAPATVSRTTGNTPVTPVVPPQAPVVPPQAPVPAPVGGVVALKSAAYDAATRTVTLTPTEPLDTANMTYSAWFPIYRFQTTAPSGRVLKLLTDLQGNALTLSWYDGLVKPVIVT